MYAATTYGKTLIVCRIASRIVAAQAANDSDHSPNTPAALAA